ncbi:hypothetical protein HELRODRAFT_189998 [Helobdella robusta]|uniref:[phosphatase 2A protein]-leucine-carboxy methyltransferase n=1 Tax=Helobdella robusta TaxID=6412 RepID=T1FRK7_HELRO|nr:hypothetical protein HELRODRAFT_189998 [Helobdella robusta]ESO11550.1 hypothetical protein HELRODRAFT_189998 [Helobdella robusta]
MASSRQDEEVQSTNDDAVNSKFSAVKLGYWQDPYIQFFSKFSSAIDRKPPELNRGYYARVKGVEYLLKQFLKKTDLKCQVVNLGAGSDTRFWLLSDQNLVPLKWVELDFEPVVNKKIRIIKSKKSLMCKLQANNHDGSSDSIPDVQIKPTEIHSNIYHIVSCDLRDVCQFKSCIDRCSIDCTIPTAFICECVFIYMDPHSSSCLVRTISEMFSDIFFINYEQVNMNDRFGEVMLSNLQNRGCALLGVQHCLNFQTQFDRFLKCGWNGIDGGDMLQIYHGLPQDDVQRIEKIEFLDDIEMLTQLFTHYCIVWAYKHSTKNTTTTTATAAAATTTTNAVTDFSTVTNDISTIPVSSIAKSIAAATTSATTAVTTNITTSTSLLDDSGHSSSGSGSSSGGVVVSQLSGKLDFSDISLFIYK